MRTVRFAVFAVLLSLTAVQSFASCGYDPVIVAPDTVNSLSTGNQASFTSNTNPAYIDWQIVNGTITSEASTVTFSANRHGYVQLTLIVGDGGTCGDAVTKVIQIVHPCVVTPLSRAISETYVGGTTTLDVEANCEWSAIVPASVPWVRIVGPSTFNGNGTVTYEVDPLPFEVSVQSAEGRGAITYVGDKDVSAHQAGWGTVGTDIIRDGNADLLWRNISNGITWMQPMTGLTAGAGATIAGASAPFRPVDWRIVTTRTWFNHWDIYWRNFATWDNQEQPFNGTGSGGSVLINHDDANWRVVGAGLLGPGANGKILRRNLANGELRISAYAYDSKVWTEPDANWRIHAVEDFDGDGMLDILWRHAGSGLCFMILSPGGGAIALAFHNEPDLNWQIVAAGDVNADGRADIVWRNLSDGRVWIQAMDGFRTVASNVVWTDADPNWNIVGMADFDGNGSKDLLWRSAAGLVFGILLDENLNVLSSGVIHNEPDPNWKIVAPNTADAALNGNH